MKLKIGDRVKLISVPNSFPLEGTGIEIEMMGTVKEVGAETVGVEFDDYICGHKGGWHGKDGHCLYVLYDQLEKIKETKEDKTNDDEVNHPKHYTAGKVECIQALEAVTIGLQGIEAVCTANIIKYLWRWKFKNGVEDLKKAKWYLNYLIEINEHGIKGA